MSAKAYELQKSRSLRFDQKNPGTSYEYIVTGAADSAAVLAALVAAGCPFAFGGFTRLPSWSADPQGGGVWEVSVPFGTPDPSQPPALFPGETADPAAAAADPSIPDQTTPGGSGSPFGPDDPFTGTYPAEGAGGNQQEVDKNTPLGPEWSFDTTGGTRTVRQALLDTARGGGATRYFGRDGSPFTFTNFKGAIGVRKSGGGYEVEGKDVPDPKLELTTTRSVRGISLAYIGLVARMTGSVNRFAFAGAEAGELLFLGASGQYKPPAGQEAGAWSISYKFAFSPNRTSDGSWEVADGITLPAGEVKEGWDLLDVTFEDKPTDGRLVPRAEQVAIHRIFPRADFRYLGFETLNF